jgi:hypothetical protein
MAKTETCLSAPRNTAFRNTYTRTSNLCSLQRTSVAPSRWPQAYFSRASASQYLSPALPLLPLLPRLIIPMAHLLTRIPALTALVLSRSLACGRCIMYLDTSRRRHTRTRSGSPGIWASLQTKQIYSRSTRLSFQLRSTLRSRPSWSTVRVPRDGSLAYTCLEAGLTLVCVVVHVRWAERPDARECWTGGQLGHPIWSWDVVPHSWNVLLDWGQPTLCTGCAHAR